LKSSTTVAGVKKRKKKVRNQTEEEERGKELIPMKLSTRWETGVCGLIRRRKGDQNFPGEPRMHLLRPKNRNGPT